METGTIGPDTTTQDSAMFGEPRDEHRWLHKLVGEWVFESDAAPDKPEEQFSGTHSVRSIGGLWIMGEGQGDMPGGGPATMIMTLGYEPTTRRFVGTWIGSMMTYLWVYDGELDASGRILTLSSDGPHMTEPGKLAKYQDVVEIVDDDHHVLHGRVLGDDGQWNEFMTTHYRRK